MNRAKNAVEGSEWMQRKMWFRPPNVTFFIIISMWYIFSMNCFLITHTFTEEFRKYLEKSGVVDAITKVGCLALVAQHD